MSSGNDSGISHKEFFEKALTAAGEWARFADPKALGVAVFLSFGANDLLRNARRLFFGVPVISPRAPRTPHGSVPFRRRSLPSGSR
jgi:hypothetical protein